MIQTTVVPPGPFRVGQEPAYGPHPMGLMVILATVTMLFAAFIAATCAAYGVDLREPW